jgi:hypothetical protein
MEEKRHVLISRFSYNELKHLAASTDKFLFQLIDEAIILLKEKYNESTRNTNN